jgi:hypothetical protein
VAQFFTVHIVLKNQINSVQIGLQDFMFDLNISACLIEVMKLNASELS